MGKLDGKVAIVTGAGSVGEGFGTGKAIATLFAREGARVVLVDIDEPSKLSIVMRGWPATVSFGSATPAYYMGAATPNAIAFASPQFDHATGDPILPARAAGWGATTVVLLHSDMLARLQGFELVGSEPGDAEACSREIIHQAHFRQPQLGGKRIPGDHPVQVGQRCAVRRHRSRH